MKNVRYHFNVALRPEPEGGFTAHVPALPGCVTHGRTLAEARKMARDAVSGYIESLMKHGEPIPTDNKLMVTSLDLVNGEL
jgi:predicted RNase H-like HicB family nuclease